MRPGHFVQRVRVDVPEHATDYPFDLPVVAELIRRGGCALAPGVTFFVGENGSGKSTVVEAIAVASGFNPEGGSQNFRFETQATQSSLGRNLTLARSGARPHTGYFLRAESYYNVASEIERLDRELEPRSSLRPLVDSYGGTSPHAQSHGESFLSLAVNRFGPAGLYLLDEPEAALSPQGCLTLLARIVDLVAQGSQFVVATHSPILLAVPGATILEVGDDGALTEVGYDDALPVRMTRDFLAAPELFLRHLT